MFFSVVRPREGPNKIKRFYISRRPADIPPFLSAGTPPASPYRHVPSSHCTNSYEMVISFCLRTTTKPATCPINVVNETHESVLLGRPISPKQTAIATSTDALPYATSKHSPNSDLDGASTISITSEAKKHGKKKLRKK